MDDFHLFWIVQMVPNRVKHQILSYVLLLLMLLLETPQNTSLSTVLSLKINNIIVFILLRTVSPLVLGITVDTTLHLKPKITN